MGVWLLRAVLVVALTTAVFLVEPFDLSAAASLSVGLVLSILVILAEMRMRTWPVKDLMGAAVGGTLGILGATMISLIVENMSFFTPRTQTFLQVLALALMAYVGLVVGMSKGELLNLHYGPGEEEAPRRGRAKILDTSVIIDGRVGDIVETGFLEGQLIVPEFVLRELQMIADSADPIKRNRGRRGLDILRKIQKKSNIKVQIVDQDYPVIREVDLKLIELARDRDAKIVTNDFNLNKVAQLRGVPVLNINELANALKAVVLPGESMSVFILKEGKEYNQGVAYLDDGTMVVVDNARRMIGKTVDIQVTSVLQTTAGKMIFGKYQNQSDSQSKGDLERERISRL